MELIGFDGRVPKSVLRSLWKTERRKNYLLDPDCIYPLSIDFISWPSVFNNNMIGVGLSRDHREELGLGKVPLPIASGQYIPFWQNLSDLAQSLLDLSLSAELIKVARVTNEGSDQVGIKHADWIFEGFDVADEGFNSVVANTSSPLFTREWKAIWKGKVNANGLFDKLNDANAFGSAVASVLHGIPPVSAYGLYTLSPRASL